MQPHPIINIRPQTCRRFLADWAGSLQPTARVFLSKAEGGSGVLSANSAALFRLGLMSRVERVDLHHRFNDWLEKQAKTKQAPPLCWTLEETIENLSRPRKVMVFGFVYRDLERNVGATDVNESLAAAALWSFGQLPEPEQQALVSHVEKRHAEQCEIDEQAIRALQRIYSVAA